MKGPQGLPSDSSRLAEEAADSWDQLTEPVPEGLRSPKHQQSADDGGTHGQSLPGEQESVRSNAWHGNGDDRDAAAPSQPECEKRTVVEDSFHATSEKAMPDLDFDFMTTGNANSFQSKIRRFTKELQSVIQHQSAHSNPRTARLDLLEVMCSEQSELTRQVLNLGGRAKRFGRVQGDLNTVEGRRKLFCIMVQEQPKHTWISPECGPWCQWSFLNMNKSLAGWENVMTQRSEKLWQIALSIVLFRFQLQNRKHFDLEQPRGSALMKTPGMSEILEHTWNEFDMCRVGNLKDPETREAYRKRMTVCSTSLDLHIALHGKLCQQEHHHRVHDSKFQPKCMAKMFSYPSGPNYILSSLPNKLPESCYMIKDSCVQHIREKPMNIPPRNEDLARNSVHKPLLTAFPMPVTTIGKMPCAWPIKQHHELEHLCKSKGN